MQGIIHRHRGGHVMHHHTDIRGQAAGRGLLACQDLYQMFFRAHRVTRRQADNLAAL